MRDSSGDLVSAFHKEFGEFDVLLAESLSLPFAIQLCVRDGFNNIIFETDSLVLTKLLGGGIVKKWPPCKVLKLNRQQLHQLQGSISHIYREGNQAANFIASMPNMVDFSRMIYTIFKS